MACNSLLSTFGAGLLPVWITSAAFAGVPSQPSEPPAPLAWTFEDQEAGTAPKGWFVPEALASAGYTVKVVDDEPFEGLRCARLSGPAQRPAQTFSNMTRALNATPYRGKTVRFRAAVRTEALGDKAGCAQMWMRVDRPDRQMGFFDNMDGRRILSDKWQTYDIVGVIDADAERIIFGVMELGGGTAWVDSASLEIVDRSTPSTDGVSARGGPNSQLLHGPGVIRASAATSVRLREAGVPGVVTFPVPGTHRNQVPLTFSVESTPAGAIKSWRWRQRDDGLNWLCEVTVEPPAEGATIRWLSDVLVMDTPNIALPRADKPEAPASAGAWLRSTRCVQSADPKIAEQARTLAEGTSDVGAYVQRVLDFTSSNRGQDPSAAFTTLDASLALACGGSCTSRANLAAALLRAHGIPARTLAHLPTWAPMLYEHWLVEYWHPGAGWVWIEPTMGLMQPKDWSLVVINVANPDDEDLSFDSVISHSGVALGAPHLAVHKHSPELLRVFLKEAENEGNYARGVLELGSLDEARLKSLRDRAMERYGAFTARAKAGITPGDEDAGDPVPKALEACDDEALSAALSGN